MAGARPLRGSRGAALVALPDRDERLPRHAQRQGAPRAPDGSRAGAGPGRREPRHAAGGHLARAGARRARRTGERSRGGRGLSRDDAARLRRGAPAPAAAPARRPDPLRGARLEGHGGRRAARHERRVGEQRPPAGAGDARGEGPDDRRARRAARGAGQGAARPLRRGVRALRHGGADLPHPRGRDPVDAAVLALAARPRRHPHLVARAGHRLSRLARDPGRGAPTAPRPSASTSRARAATATSRGRCRCSRSRTAGSSSSRSSSARRRSSRSSASRRGFRRSVLLGGQHVCEAHERDEIAQLPRRAPQPELAAGPPGGELEPRERFDRHRIGVGGPDVADRDVRAAALQAARRSARTGRPDRRGRPGRRA